MTEHIHIRSTHIGPYRITSSAVISLYDLTDTRTDTVVARHETMQGALDDAIHRIANQQKED